MHPLTGADQMVLLEAAPQRVRSVSAELEVAAALAGRVADSTGGGSAEWHDAVAVDLDVLLLRLRQMVLGDVVRGEARCPVEGCGERILVAFGIESFLAHAAPSAAAQTTPDADGWFTLGRTDGSPATRFRLPTPRDLAAAMRAARPERELARRCIVAPEGGAAARRQAERAMEALAPLRPRELAAPCPACGTRVGVHFDIRRFCLQELRDLATFLHDDVDLLARHYHWSEASILALPSLRRARYAGIVREHEAAV